MTKITDKFISRLHPVDVEYYNDDGLMLTARPSGKCTFFGKVVNSLNKVKKIKIGEWPRMSVSDARRALWIAKDEAKLLAEQDPDLTFEEFVEGQFKEWIYANNKSAEDSMRVIRKLFVLPFGKLSLREITPNRVETWKTDRLKKVQPATVCRNLTELRCIMHRADDWFDIPNTMPKVKNPKVNQEKQRLYLNDAELERLHNICQLYIKYAGTCAKWVDDNPKDCAGNYMRLDNMPAHLPYIVLVALNTGMRQGEILKIKWRAINIEERTITVEAATEKTARARTLPISNKLMEIIKEWASKADVSPNKRVFDFDDICHSWATMRQRADLTHIDFHTLRHHVGSSLVLKGVALPVVMKILGHTNLKTTQRYLSVRDTDTADAIELL